MCKASSSSLLPLLFYIHILTICDFYILNIEKKSSYDDSEFKCIDNFSFMEAYLQLKRQHNLLCTQELSSLRVPCTCAMRVNCMQEFTRQESTVLKIICNVSNCQHDLTRSQTNNDTLIAFCVILTEKAYII